MHPYWMFTIHLLSIMKLRIRFILHVFLLSAMSVFMADASVPVRSELVVSQAIELDVKEKESVKEAADAFKFVDIINVDGSGDDTFVSTVNAFQLPLPVLCLFDASAFSILLPYEPFGVRSKRYIYFSCLKIDCVS